MTVNTKTAGSVNQSKISTQILEHLDGLGYRIKESKTYMKNLGQWNRPHDWNLSHKDFGVRIAMTQDTNGLDMKVNLRTEIGTYKLAVNVGVRANGGIQGPWFCRAHWSVDYLTEHLKLSIMQANNRAYKEFDITGFEKWLEKLRGLEATDKLKKKSDLDPVPYSLNDTRHEGDTVVLNHFLYSCTCADIVAINEKLQVTQEGIAEPDASCWFRLTGHAHVRTGLTRVDFITDAEIKGIHPVTYRDSAKFKGFQVTNNLRPDNGKLDYNRFSVLDKTAVTEAVMLYLQKHKIGWCV